MKYKYVIFTKSDSSDYYSYVIDSKIPMTEDVLEQWLFMNANDREVDEAGVTCYEEIILWEEIIIKYENND